MWRHWACSSLGAVDILGCSPDAHAVAALGPAAGIRWAAFTEANTALTKINTVVVEIYAGTRLSVQQISRAAWVKLDGVGAEALDQLSPMRPLPEILAEGFTLSLNSPAVTAEWVKQARKALDAKERAAEAEQAAAAAALSSRRLAVSS